MAINTPEAYNMHNSPELSKLMGEQPQATDYAFAEEVRQAVAKLGGMPENSEIQTSLSRIGRMLDSIEQLGGKTARELAELKMEVHRKNYEANLELLRRKQSGNIFRILSGEDAPITANEDTYEQAA